MAGKRKSRAFRRGFWLAGLASAGALVWNAPQPGARTREQVMEGFEGVLFALLDMTDRLSTVGGGETRRGADGAAPARADDATEPFAIPAEPAGSPI